MRIFVGLLAIVSALLWRSPAEAMTFSVTQFDTLALIKMSGRIEPADTERLSNLIREQRNRELVLSVNSPGGSVVAGAEMAEIIARFRLAVLVPPHAQCASACFLLFAASPERMASRTAMIGVHASSIDGRENTQTMAVTTIIAREAHRWGVPSDIVGRMVITLPDDIYWITAADRRAMRVIDYETLIAAPMPPAPAPAPAPAAPAQRRSTWVTEEPLPPPQQPATQPHASPTHRVFIADFPASGFHPDFFRENESFLRGLSDRSRWEHWLNLLGPMARAGAQHWASQRSLASPQPCFGEPVAITACNRAREVLAEFDAQRTSNPEYRRGWNSFIPSVYQSIVATAEQACRARGSGLLGPRRGFDTERDYNNDGRPDYLLNLNGLVCEDGRNTCGSGGCNYILIMAVRDGYRTVFNRPVRSFRITTEPLTVIVSVDGRDCGRADAAECVERLVWNGETFSSMGTTATARPRRQ